MRTLAISAIASSLVACSGAKGPSEPPTRRIAALGALMKNEINPAFSKLIVLAFHAETMNEDPKAIRAEMQRTAGVLQTTIGRLRAWSDPPVDSPEGREVFYTYAGEVERSSLKLVDAIARGDAPTTQRQLEHIANTCNSCHHFFRLHDVEDSVVPSQ